MHDSFVSAMKVDRIIERRKEKRDPPCQTKGEKEKQSESTER
jgi:hypothetical protein